MLPINLAYGEISLYSIYQTGITGVQASSGSNFGLVDQVSMYGIIYTKVGDSVLFGHQDIQCILTYGGWQYRAISEDAVLATEIPLP